MREGRCISLIECLKQGSELKSTLSIGKLFQRFMTCSVKKLDLTELLYSIYSSDYVSVTAFFLVQELDCL